MNEDDDVIGVQDGPTVDDTIALEIGADEIQPNNSIADLLNAIEDGEYNAAEDKFSDLIGDRLQVALDQKKAEVAARIYGADVNATPEEVMDELDNEEDEDTAEMEGKEIFSGSYL